MTFKNKGFTYYMTFEPRGIISLRVSVGYVDVKNEVYEVTFDI
jgi:hypothetical protein